MYEYSQFVSGSVRPKPLHSKRLRGKETASCVCHRYACLKIIERLCSYAFRVVLLSQYNDNDEIFDSNHWLTACTFNTLILDCIDHSIIYKHKNHCERKPLYDECFTYVVR
ncbi:hypothetical protein DICVIV_03642 [Dictyocaulus viviparus]|uniref:Uncharacterized protein n=1 Tax=Dictyocaulus viviparus TaxID=29172 RepID=A0A0D8Y022_DICVI|nr:hypothetical protein DICVIV_03642 [Dictyocaulus viviparus]